MSGTSIYTQRHIIMKHLPKFVKQRRKQLNLTQVELAEKAGVGLTVVRKIEQGKENLSMTKVNQVLMMFGHTLQPVNFKELKKELSKIGKIGI